MLAGAMWVISSLLTQTLREMGIIKEIQTQGDYSSINSSGEEIMVSPSITL